MWEEFKNNFNMYLFKRESNKEYVRKRAFLLLLHSPNGHHSQVQSGLKPTAKKQLHLRLHIGVRDL